jgi:hypothetical protein
MFCNTKAVTSLLIMMMINCAILLGSIAKPSITRVPIFIE